VPTGAILRRQAARAGDRLCVTGTIGDAALGLALRLVPDPALEPLHRDALLDRYLHPRPRLALAPVLRRHARASMDVSDGLAGDLTKMFDGTGLTARIDVPAVPLSPAAQAAIAGDARRIDTALTGGDDYEILCAVPPDAVSAFLAEARAAGVPVAEIGTVEAGDGPPRFRDAHGRAMDFARASFSHF